MPSVINNGVLKTGKPFLRWLQPLLGHSEDGSRQPTQRVLPPSETPSISASPPPPHLFQSLMEITVSKTFLHLLLLFRALHKKPPCWPLPWPAPCPSLRGCPSHSRKHEFIATHACLALLSLCCETLKPRLAFLTTIITFSWKGHSITRDK